MHKVVIERPRWNPGPGKNGRRANLPVELLPKFEGIKRPHQCRKGLTDLLGPLKRWLQSQVGRHWNDVYSEACAVIKPDSIIRAHVKTHLLQFVERNTFMHDGKVCVLDTGYRSRGVIPVTELRYGWTRFFVHPESGLLFAIPQRSWKTLRAERRTARAETFRWLECNFALKQIGGIWFACQFRVVSPDGSEWARFPAGKYLDYVAERVIDAVCAFDYPDDRLEIRMENATNENIDARIRVEHSIFVLERSGLAERGIADDASEIAAGAAERHVLQVTADEPADRRPQAVEER